MSMRTNSAALELYMLFTSQKTCLLLYIISVKRNVPLLFYAYLCESNTLVDLGMDLLVYVSYLATM